jgi:DNA modification methylase
MARNATKKTTAEVTTPTSPFPTHQVKKINLTRVNPAPYNPRLDLQPGDAAYNALRRSLQEFGLVEPLVFNEATGNLVGGHQRLKVLLEQGVTEADAVIVSLDDAREKALNVALNKINGDWDLPKLADLLEELKLSPIGCELTGFDQREIDEILVKFQDVTPGDTDPDEVPGVPAEATTQQGDIWLLGTHRLMCGDATDADQVKALLDGQMADVTFTDPPYNVDYDRGRKILNDNLGTDFEVFLAAACRNILEATKGAIYVCMSSSELHTLQRAFTQAGGHWSTFIIWAKNTFTLGRADYQRQYEPILYGWREGGEHFWCGDRNQGDVWAINKPIVNDLHPTMKPTELVIRALRNSSPPGAAVLDLFGGSGSTMIAAEQTGRRAFLMELDPLYCDVIVTRWENFTGKKAVRT